MEDAQGVTGMFNLRVNGVELECLDEGTGTPVVFSHGGSSDVRYWLPQREAFASTYRFVAFSRRFHGRGDWPAEGDYSTEAHVSDLLEVVRGLGAGPAHLVGFSTSLSLRAALVEPDLFASLTVIEPNVPWVLEGDPEGEAVLRWWRAENERVRQEAAGDPPAEARLWFELVNNQGPGTFDAQPAGLRELWLDNFTAVHPVAPPPEPLTQELLRTVRVPTLVVAAEHGMPFSRRIVDVVAACIPGARREVVPGVTHFMSYQAPDAFNERVLAFLG